MPAFKQIKASAFDRPVVRGQYRPEGRTLLSVRLEDTGNVAVATHPHLNSWEYGEHYLGTLVGLLAYPEAAPQEGSKRHPTRGRVFDLAAIYERLNQAYFDGLLRVGIGWSREGGKGQKRQHSIQFGAYCYDDRMIRINPVLDAPNVPLYYLEYVMYHEMCHAYVGIETDKAGRPRYHGRLFKERENRYEHIAFANDWEKNNLDRFLNTGKNSDLPTA